MSTPPHGSRWTDDLAGSIGNTPLINQFDNLTNREGQRATTGLEIWEQMAGRLDAFTCSCDTGGTLAGNGLSRVTETLDGAPIDDAERIPAAEAVEQVA